MLARTHLAFALGIATLPLYALSLVDKATLQGVEVSLYLGGIALGSLLPDIDEPNSTLGRQLPLLSSLIHRLFGHRGATHSFLFPFGVALLGWGIASSQGIALEAVIGLWLGVWLHLIGDMLTKSGIPLWLPWSERPIALLPLSYRFKTGGIIDLALGGIFGALFTYLGLNLWGGSLLITRFL